MKTFRTNQTGSKEQFSPMKQGTSLNLSTSRPTSLGKRGSIQHRQKNSLTSYKPKVTSAREEEFKLTPAREDLSTTEYSQRKFKILDSTQKHHSPKALVLVNANQHGMLTTESEMPPHFEEVKEMQIISRVAALNTSSTNPLSGPNSTRKTGTPYQGQGHQGQCQDSQSKSKK